MWWLNRLVKFLAVSIGFMVFAQSHLGHASSGKTPLKSDEKVTVKIFKQNLRSDLKRTLCEKGSYFTTCFQTQQADCESYVEAQFSSCENGPTKMGQVISSKRALEAAEKIGGCVGTELEKKLSPVSPLPAKCKDWRSWL